jgi:Histidine kinase-, DNA gyrase B-, and HSP90-like ATPase
LRDFLWQDLAIHFFNRPGRFKLGASASGFYPSRKSFRTFCLGLLLLETSLIEIVALHAIDAPVECDTHRIGQLTSNLLGNAITYGAPNNPIRLDAPTAGGQFELFIANSGGPIPPAALDKIFEPFERGALRSSLQGSRARPLHLMGARKGPWRHVRGLIDNGRNRFTFQMPLAE